MKGRNSCFYPQKPATWTQEDCFFFFFFSMVACFCISEHGVAEGSEGASKVPDERGSNLCVWEQQRLPSNPISQRREMNILCEKRKRRCLMHCDRRNIRCGANVRSTPWAIELMPCVLPALSGCHYTMARCDWRPTVPKKSRGRSVFETFSAVKRCNFSCVEGKWTNF